MIIRGKVIFRAIPAVITLIIFALSVISCGNKNTDKTESEVLRGDDKGGDSLVLVVQGSDGKSILEVTEAEYDVDYVESSMGAFIKGIDSIRAGDGYAWFISVNDSMIKISADRYVTGDSDIVKWHFRKL